MINSLFKDKQSNIKKVQKESVITNADTFILTSLNTYLFMIKNHFRSSSFYLGNLFIPFIVVLSVGIYFPIGWVFSWMLFIPMTFSGLATYGTLFFTIRKSTMIKNIQMTTNESGTLYFATFWVIFTSLFITLLMIFASITFLELSGLANYSFFYNETNLVEPWTTPDQWVNYWVIDYSEIWWSMIIYYWVVQTFLCFSMAFFIEKVVSTQKNFFIIVLIYLVGGLVFGGLFASTLDVENGQIVIFDSSGEVSEGRPAEMLWGEPLWWVSQFLWPHYSLNQMAGNSLMVGAHHYVPDGSQDVSGIINNIDNDVWGNVYDDVTYWSPWHEVTFTDSIKSAGSIYYMVMPWVWCLIFIFIAGMMERYDR